MHPYLLPRTPAGLQRGERTVPTERPQAMLSAADLPRCDLSDFIEARLARTLAQERVARAAALGVHPSTLPTAHGITGEGARGPGWAQRRPLEHGLRRRRSEACTAGCSRDEGGCCQPATPCDRRCMSRRSAVAHLPQRPRTCRSRSHASAVSHARSCFPLPHPPFLAHPHEPRPLTKHAVRVVNNVTKKNEVRQRFLDAFRGEGYPEAFMYRQKVVLLFQNRDGVDLCVYCLYVQEYGDEAPEPNRKCIYLSYLDSVKYLEPEEVQAAGRAVALRTMIYHEVLLGYLSHAKQRGFLQMYIWACPPLQVCAPRGGGMEAGAANLGHSPGGVGWSGARRPPPPLPM